MQLSRHRRVTLNAFLAHTFSGKFALQEQLYFCAMPWWVLLMRRPFRSPIELALGYLLIAAILTAATGGRWISA
jgi:hypothetical protein